MPYTPTVWKTGDIVSSEKLNKLEQGVADATSEEIIESWLDEHINPQTGYAVDNTLSVTGAAADAKATGDALTAQSVKIEAIDELLEIPAYYSGSGTGYGSGAWVRIIEGINLTDGKKYKITVYTESAPSGNINWTFGTSDDGLPATTNIITGLLTSSNYSQPYSFTKDGNMTNANVRIYGNVNSTVYAVVEEDADNVIDRIDDEIDDLKELLDVTPNHWDGNGTAYGSGNWVDLISGISLKKDVAYRVHVYTKTAPSADINWTFTKDGTLRNGTLTSSKYDSGEQYYTPSSDLDGAKVRIYAPQANITVYATVDGDIPSDRIDAVGDKLENYGGIFNTLYGAEYTEAISRLVKKIYIPDETLKGQLFVSQVSKTSNNGEKTFKISAVVGGTSTVIYDYADGSINQIASGIEIHELLRTGYPSGYVLLDWNEIDDNSSFTSLSGNAYLLSDYCFDIKYAPQFFDTLFWQNYYSGKTLELVKMSAGEVSGSVYEIPHNYDVPVNKESFYLSADIDQAYITDTDEKRIRSLIPYLYFNGQKIGTVVLFDSNGDPYIIDANGQTKHITVT